MSFDGTDDMDMAAGAGAAGAGTATPEQLAAMQAELQKAREERDAQRAENRRLNAERLGAQYGLDAATVGLLAGVDRDKQEEQAQAIAEARKSAAAPTPAPAAQAAPPAETQPQAPEPTAPAPAPAAPAAPPEPVPAGAAAMGQGGEGGSPVLGGSNANGQPLSDVEKIQGTKNMAEFIQLAQREADAAKRAQATG